MYLLFKVAQEKVLGKIINKGISIFLLSLGLNPNIQDKFVEFWKTVLKRFELGIEAMKYIIKEIPECKMNFISDLKGISFLQDLVIKLKLEKKVIFLGYTSTPEIYFKNASLHIFPSISESFGLVLCETKIYGIPTILLGLDYVSISKGGTIIIYDDNPIQISKEAIKILNNDIYRKKLGKEARDSMAKHTNEIVLKKWTKLEKI